MVAHAIRFLQDCLMGHGLQQLCLSTRCEIPTLLNCATQVLEFFFYSAPVITHTGEVVLGLAQVAHKALPFF